MTSEVCFILSEDDAPFLSVETALVPPIYRRIELQTEPGRSSGFIVLAHSYRYTPNCAVCFVTVTPERP